MEIKIQAVSDAFGKRGTTATGMAGRGILIQSNLGLPLPVTEVLAQKHQSMILEQWSNPVSGAWKSQASSPWAKQYRALTCCIMEKPDTGLDECPRILLSCFRARNSGRRLPQRCFVALPSSSLLAFVVSRALPDAAACNDDEMLALPEIEHFPHPLSLSLSMLCVLFYNQNGILRL